MYFRTILGSSGIQPDRNEKKKKKNQHKNRETKSKEKTKSNKKTHNEVKKKGRNLYIKGKKQ